MFPHADRFPVLMLVSLVVFGSVLWFVLRKRRRMPSWLTIGAISAIVIVGGMTYARVTQTLEWPWWLYYGVPAAATIFMPPIALRMSRNEKWQYIVLAYLSAPAINVVFSFALGWHDYMPFMHVPYWKNVIRL